MGLPTAEQLLGQRPDKKSTVEDILGPKPKRKEGWEQFLTSEEYARFKAPIEEDTSKPLDIAMPAKALGVGAAETFGQTLKAAARYPIVMPYISKDGKLRSPDKVQEFLRSTGEKIQQLPSEERKRQVYEAQQGVLFPKSYKELPEAWNAWAAAVMQNIPYMIQSQLGAAGGALMGGAMFGRAGAKIGSVVGGTGMVALPESQNFLDAAEELNLDKDIADKYASIYGVGSGTIEYLQQALMAGPWVGALRKAIGKEVGQVSGKALADAEIGIYKKILKEIGATGVEGLQEISQEGLQVLLLRKAVKEQKKRDPEFKHPPLTFESLKRSGIIGAGISAITRGAGGAATAVTPARRAPTEEAGSYIEYEKTPEGWAPVPPERRQLRPGTERLFPAREMPPPVEISPEAPRETRAVRGREVAGELPPARAPEKSPIRLPVDINVEPMDKYFPDITSYAIEVDGKEAVVNIPDNLIGKRLTPKMEGIKFSGKLTNAQKQKALDYVFVMNYREPIITPPPKGAPLAAVPAPEAKPAPRPAAKPKVSPKNEPTKISPEERQRLDEAFKQWKEKERAAGLPTEAAPVPEAQAPAEIEAPQRAEKEKQAARKKARKPRKSNIKTFIGLVQRLGGIKPGGEYEDVPRQAIRKNGLSMDDMAATLQAQGFLIVPENRNPSDVLWEKLSRREKLPLESEEAEKAYGEREVPTEFVVAGDLKEGQRVLIDNDWHVVKKIPEKGQIILQDGTRKVFDPFDKVEVQYSEPGKIGIEGPTQAESTPAAPEAEVSGGSFLVDVQENTDENGNLTRGMDYFRGQLEKVPAGDLPQLEEWLRRPENPIPYRRLADEVSSQIRNREEAGELEIPGFILPEITDKMVEQYAAKAVGEGFPASRYLREATGKEKWGSLSTEQKVSEIKKSIDEDLKTVKKEIQGMDPKEVEDYFINRVLDPLDPLNEFYAEMLNKAGYEAVAGKQVQPPPRTRIEKTAAGDQIVPEELRPQAVVPEGKIKPKGEIKPIEGRGGLPIFETEAERKAKEREGKAQLDIFAEEKPPSNSEIQNLLNKYLTKDFSEENRPEKPPFKDIVFRVLAKGEWESLLKGETYSGAAWSTDPTEYGHHAKPHPSTGYINNVIAVSKRKGSPRFRGIVKTPQEAAITHYQEIENKELGDIIAAFRWEGTALKGEFKQIYPEAKKTLPKKPVEKPVEAPGGPIAEKPKKKAPKKVNIQNAFTPEQVDDYNRYTHYPQDINKEYAENMGRVIDETRAKLKNYGIEKIPGEVQTALDRYARALKENYLATAKSRAVAPSPMVVGRSNYKGNRKKAHAIEQKAINAMDKAQSDLAAAIKRQSPNAPISSDRPTAIEEIEDRISVRTEKQELMKAVNKAYSNYKKNKKSLDTAPIPEVYKNVIRKFEPDPMLDRPFPAYELTNNGAEIRRLKKRVEQLKAQRKDVSKGVSFEGGAIIDNVEENRLQIKYDKKPDAETIKKLKSFGFKWAPSKGVWQRFRGSSANYAAREVTGVDIRKDQEYKVRQEYFKYSADEAAVAYGGKQLAMDFESDAIKEAAAVNVMNFPLPPQLKGKSAKKFKKNGFLDFRGIKVENAADVAELFHIYRDPKIEKQVAVFVDENNKITAHYVVTSGHASQVKMNKGYIDKIKSIMKRTNAVRLYLQHNHPSGIGYPSGPDKSFISKMKFIYNVDNVVGIVTNHDQYSTITPGKDTKGVFVNIKKGTYKEAKEKFPVGKEIRSTEDAIKYFTSYDRKEGKTLIFYLDAQLRLNACQPINRETAQKPTINNLIKNGMAAHKADFYIIITEDFRELPLKYLPYGVVDVIDYTADNNAYISLNRSSPQLIEKMSPDDELDDLFKKFYRWQREDYLSFLQRIKNKTYEDSFNAFLKRNVGTTEYEKLTNLQLQRLIVRFLKREDGLYAHEIRQPKARYDANKKFFERELTPAERKKYVRQLRSKTRQQLLNQIARRMKSFNPRYWKNFMMKHFQVEQFGGLSDRDLRRLLVLVEERKHELIIPIYPKHPETLEDPERVDGARPIPGFKVVSNLKRFGKPGKKLAEMYETYEKDRAQMIGSMILRFEEAIKVAGGAHRWPEVVNVIEGGHSDDKRIRDAALIWKQKIADPIANRAEMLEMETINSAGFIRPFEPRKNYWPHRWDYNEIAKEKNKKRIIQKIADMNNISVERATEIYERFREDLKSKKFSHLENQREYELPEYRTDAQVGWMYIMGAADRLSWVKNFGKDTFVGIAKGFAPEKTLDVIGRLSTEEQRDYVRTFFKRMEDRNRRSRLSDFSDTVRTLQLVKLSFASIPNFFQHFTNTWSKVGTEAYVKALIRRFSKEGKRFARISGAVTPQLDAEMAEMGSNRKIPKYVEGYLKGVGFTWTETNNRIISAIAGEEYAKILYRRARHGAKWRQEYIREELEKLFINLDELKESGALSEKNLRDAGYAISKMTQFTAKTGHLPLTWTTPLGRMLTQFKNFAYNQSSFLFNEAMIPAADFVKTGGRKGTVLPFFRALVAVTISGMIVEKIRQLVFRRKILDKDRPLYLRMLIWAMQAGGFGIATDALFAVQYGEKGLYSLIGGPTISDIVNTIYRMYETSEAVATGDWERFRIKAIDTIVRLAPVTRTAAEITIPEYGRAKAKQKLYYLAIEVRKRYRRYVLDEDFKKAGELWNAFQVAYGKEWQKLYGKPLAPPTLADIYRRSNR